MSQRPKIRCAIYTRKSSDDGLEQDFNSLDAQHEACAAYVASQRHEGWKLLPARYDDGGVSGGTLERPALQRLLADIEARRVDMVVVYKIDRLTRSLADFARLVDRLEQADCSFVSVTQAFNTSSSMGRLTLNVLLSFAQFEREVTAERIRDKIAASKKKGLWMGGVLPLGYDRHPDPLRRELVVNPEEARTVNRLFELYAEHGCLRQVTALARSEGLRSKRQVYSTGRTSGGQSLSRGQLHYLLRNPVYRGRIRHKDKEWPGLQPPIIDDILWAKVQSRLDAARNGPRRMTSGQNRAVPSWLSGKLRDDTGDRLTPTHTVKGRHRHRYYVSGRLLSGTPDPAGWRLRAPDLERMFAQVVIAHLRHHAARHTILASPDASRAERVAQQAFDFADAIDTDPSQTGQLIASGVLYGNRLSLRLDSLAVANALGVSNSKLADELLSVDAPFTLRRRGVETRIIAGERLPAPDPVLRATLIRAHGWVTALRKGIPLSQIATDEKISESYLRTRIRFAFLSPRIQQAILAGTQPVDLTAQRLATSPIPLDWQEQDRHFGFTPTNGNAVI
ncbi:recombinase family protein [Thalassovita sp.]|uniref:recombinase family protein n=1 Tax=Thalassovita sp. TaxID=1979401 RepID=UPI0029DE5199|nr:recombinase family protein [Thalassovita sp.]